MPELPDGAPTLPDRARVVLGTAQFGMPYGRRRGEAALDERAVYEILDAAWDLGIRAFDTAEAYGRGAELLAGWLRSRGRLENATVVTKISAAAVPEPSQVEAACRRFAGVRLVTVMSHGALDPLDYSRLKALAGSFGAEAGQSLYTADEVRAAAQAGATRVQAPANVLDTRQIEAAHQSAISIDARSVYLQGLLLDAPEIAERRARTAGELALAVRTAALNCGLAPAAALLAGVFLHLAPADRAVVGIDAVNQLDDVEEALSASRESVRQFVNNMSPAKAVRRLDPALLDPRTWS